MSSSPQPEASNMPEGNSSPAPPSPAPEDEQPATQAGPQTQMARQLDKDVFGGADSDDDDDDEDGGERDHVDDGDDEEEGGDEYRPATETSTAKIPSFKKRRIDGAGTAGESEKSTERDGGDEPRRRKKSKRRERERDDEGLNEDEDEPDLDEATQRRLALEERIENIGKKPRGAPRRKKKGGEDVDIVDTYHDEICIRLRDRMMAAAAKDVANNNDKLPATSKLSMLNEVVDTLQNTTLWSSIIDNEVLKAVKQWLEPLPDRSLPAVGIQKAFFEVLPKMDLDTPTIREAGLGPIVLFYTKTKRVTPAITRAADQLVQTWSRPIIKRPSDYRSKYIATADDVEQEAAAADDDVDMEEGDAEASQSRSRSQDKGKKPRRFNVQQALRENANRKGASMPRANEIQYTVAPESRRHTGDNEILSRIQRDNKKFNAFARNIKGRSAR